MGLADRDPVGRTFEFDYELRSDGDGRTVWGLAVPFGVETPIRDGEGDYDEQFARGSFSKTLAEGKRAVKVLDRHSRASDPLGSVTSAVETSVGLEVEMRFADTARADEVLELIRVKAMDGLSVGFIPVKTNWSERDGRRKAERTEVALLEVSIASFAAYPDALISGVREIDDLDLNTLVVEAVRQALHDDGAATEEAGQAADDGTSLHRPNARERALIARSIRK